MQYLKKQAKILLEKPWVGGRYLWLRARYAELRRSREAMWLESLLSQLRIPGAVLVLPFLILFLLALVAAFVTILRVFGGAESNLGTGALIVALLGAPFLIWRTFVAQKTLEFQKEGLMTDRISKAVEQLGAEKTVKVPVDGGVAVERTDPNIEVRIGGILSLERIAQDSVAYDKGRDHVRVMEILCAYIRQNAPASGAKDHDLGDWKPLKANASLEEREAHIAKRRDRMAIDVYPRESAIGKWAMTLPPPRADIAIALRVIGRRTFEQRRAEAHWGENAALISGWIFDASIAPPAKVKFDEIGLIESYLEKLDEWMVQAEEYSGYILDLSGTNLQGSDLQNLVLSGTRFDHARLEGANLAEAELRCASFCNAKLGGASLFGSRAEGAVFRSACLEGTFLSSARIDRVEISECKLEGASFRGASCIGTAFNFSYLESAAFLRARMEKAKFLGVQLEGALFMQARMHGAYFWEVVTDEDSDFESTDLDGAIMTFRVGSTIKLAAFQYALIFSNSSINLLSGPTISDPDWPRHWPKLSLGLQFYSEAEKWKADPSSYLPPNS